MGRVMASAGAVDFRNSVSNKFYHKMMIFEEFSLSLDKLTINSAYNGKSK